MAREGNRVTAEPRQGNQSYPVLEAAPGSYVVEK
jgi:poly(3-hydroxyalkanoate) synthetase